MAEELDGIQKPKVELIKKQKTEQNAQDGGGKHGPAERGERRKVIVVKKKHTPPGQASGSPGQSPGASNVRGPGNAAQSSRTPGASRKPQPRIIITSARSPVDGGSPPAAPPDAAPAREAGAKGEAPGKPKPENRNEHSQVVSLPSTQRPAAAAGRVGGRLVGNRPHQEGNRSHAPFPQRPPGAAGRVGGKPVGFRSGSGGNAGGNTGGGLEGNRPAYRSGGGNRPFGGGSGGLVRPGGNRSGGGRSGFGGNRPFGGGSGGVRPGNRTGGNAPPAGTPLPEGKGPGKKSFKPKKTVYQRKEQEMEEKLLQTKKKIANAANPVPKSIDIMEVISVSDLARKLNLKVSEVITTLMRMGTLVTINEQIDADTAAILADEYGAKVNIVSLYDETLIDTEADEEAAMQARPPVVTIMGHVDHGKTKLLDAIRSANVVDGEFGGITQHIGAYTVETPNGSITFLDTPGHEAFTRMRARGAQVTDIVVLVVAADDGVMPQTIEAINHAKDANVPIIVAVNKIDKPDANPDRVKSQLSELGFMPDAWGGQTMFVEISALKKEGIDKLIEAILLESDMQNLKANYQCRAEGKILEARIDSGRGIVATVIIERGTLRIGDSFVAGIWPGKVRALFSDQGKKIVEATPSMPVEVLGFEGNPNAGEPFQVVEDEKFARSISAKRQELKRSEDAKRLKKVTLANLHDTISEGDIQELKVIIKSDVQGSAEALRSSLEKLSTNEVRLNVIQALPGAINEGDVDLAIASNAIVIGFNVRPVPKAKALADQEKVDIRKYNVIYKAVEEIQQAMEGMLKPDIKEEVIAMVEIRELFKVPKIGAIAGCYVQSGTIKRNANVHVIREGIVIHTGKIGSLKRFKDDVREVASGFECGLGIEGFDGIQTGDQLEVFDIIEVARKLSGHG